MLAARFDGQRLGVAQVPVPDVEGTREARIRVTLAGICSTDREITRGYLGFVGTPGHEFVGVVEAAPSAPQWVGRRVVGDINAACGDCATCRRGYPTHCPNRTTLGIVGRNGAHAELLTLPINNLFAVPHVVADVAAVFVEPLAAAFEPLAQGLTVQVGAPAVVVGDGKLGLLQARVLQLAGADVTVVGHHERKRHVAEAWGLGFMHGDDSGLHARQVPIVAECTGSPAGLARALELCEPRGTLILKSTYAGAAHVDLTPVVVNEITLLGSRCGPFPEAIAALVAGHVAVSDLVDDEFPLRAAEAAYARAAERGVLKVLLRP
ncbi:MAG: alcohol dehydrogenase catalytic domain-containing protein [Chloroflexi bacterium]|nr:alcohol dehydrogenase catalytic domain-containing protein [Chloroflexota bacterium]